MDDQVRTEFRDLERMLSKRFDDLSDKIQHIELEVTTLKAKSAVWGAVSGAILSIIFFLADFLKKT